MSKLIKALPMSPEPENKGACGHRTKAPREEEKGSYSDASGWRRRKEGLNNGCPIGEAEAVHRLHTRERGKRESIPVRSNRGRTRPPSEVDLFQDSHYGIHTGPSNPTCGSLSFRSGINLFSSSVQVRRSRRRRGRKPSSGLIKLRRSKNKGDQNLRKKVTNRTGKFTHLWNWNQSHFKAQIDFHATSLLSVETSYGPQSSSIYHIHEPRLWRQIEFGHLFPLHSFQRRMW